MMSVSLEYYQFLRIMAESAFLIFAIRPLLIIIDVRERKKFNEFLKNHARNYQFDIF